jgi:hypothetical protein
MTAYTDDLIRRLRQHDGFLGNLVEEAADEIERLVEAAEKSAVTHRPDGSVSVSKEPRT